MKSQMSRFYFLVLIVPGAAFAGALSGLDQLGGGNIDVSAFVDGSKPGKPQTSAVDASAGGEGGPSSVEPANSSAAPATKRLSIDSSGVPLAARSKEDKTQSSGDVPLGGRCRGFLGCAGYVAGALGRGAWDVATSPKILVKGLYDYLRTPLHPQHPIQEPRHR